MDRERVVMIDVLESMMMEGVAAGGLARRIPTAELAVELMERARTEEPGLVGPGGLLAGLTKRVLEAEIGRASCRERV